MDVLQQVPSTLDEKNAQELYDLIQLRLKNEKREAELKAYFKRATGTRVFGGYEIHVASNTKMVLDGDAVRALLGSQTPMKPQLQVQLDIRRL